MRRAIGADATQAFYFANLGEMCRLSGRLDEAVAAGRRATAMSPAQIEAAQLNLDYASVRSPIDGRTGARLVDVGNIVHATDNTGLVSITQLRPIFLSFIIPQQQFDAVRQGQAISPIEAHAYTQDGQKELAVGKLTLIDNQVDAATGTLHMKAQFDNADASLWPGEFVNLRLVVSTEKNAVTVPARAIQQGPDGNYLFTIKPDDTVEMRKVEVSQTEEDVAVIKKGLSPGERVVVDGQFRLEPCAKVAIRTAAN